MNSSRRRKLRLWETFHGTLMLPVTLLFIAAAIATGLLTFYHERWHAHHEAAQQLDILADTVKANVERFLKDCRYDTLHQTRWLSFLPALKEATGTGPQARTARDELSRILRRICEERGLYDDILFLLTAKR